jgi:hypothetical protein
VFFWYVGTSWVFVALVFQSPALDYRLVMLGSVLPLLDAVTGGAGVLHSLLFSVLLLVVVMLLTRHRRLARRRWIGLPIGTFVYLVLSGIWATSVVFWWPFFGWSFDGTSLPEVARGGWSFVLDLCGIAVSLWGIRRFGLTSPEARRRFIKTGQLPRQAVG